MKFYSSLRLPPSSLDVWACPTNDTRRKEKAVMEIIGLLVGAAVLIGIVWWTNGFIRAVRITAYGARGDRR